MICKQVSWSLCWLWPKSHFFPLPIVACCLGWMLTTCATSPSSSVLPSTVNSTAIGWPSLITSPLHVISRWLKIPLSRGCHSRTLYATMVLLTSKTFLAIFLHISSNPTSQVGLCMIMERTCWFNSTMSLYIKLNLQTGMVPLLTASISGQNKLVPMGRSYQSTLIQCWSRVVDS